MDREEEKVNSLKKIGLQVDWLPGPGASRGDAAPESFSFVFGVGSEGLSPLEMRLQGLAAGETVTVPVPAEGPALLFGHLAFPAALGGAAAGGELRITVTGVAPAEQREIIQAMAEGAACGSDCCGH